MNRAFVALVVLFGALSAAPAAADVVVLKDGARFEGEVLEKTEKVVRLRLEGGRVRTFRMKDVESVETDAAAAPPGPVVRPPNEAQMRHEEETRRIEALMGERLATVVKSHVVVRGDHPAEEMAQIADAAETTVLHFLDTFGIDASQALPTSRAYEGGSLEVFRFRQERGYRRYMDKVLDRMRDETVSDARFDLMRRQRGFWILSPRPIVCGYQGPSPVERVVAAVSHTTSHTLLMTWEPAGAWMPWWFLEGFATWQEIELHGHNLTYCMDLAKPGDYVEQGGPDADEAAKSKTAKIWRDKVRRMVRDDEAKDLRVLGRLTLNELNLEEVIQSWSVVTWIRRQDKLEEFTLAYKRGNDLSGAFQESLGVAVEEAEARWRRWALGP